MSAILRRATRRPVRFGTRRFRRERLRAALACGAGSCGDAMGTLGPVMISFGWGWHLCLGGVRVVPGRLAGRALSVSRHTNQKSAAVIPETATFLIRIVSVSPILLISVSAPEAVIVSFERVRPEPRKSSMSLPFSKSMIVS